MKAYHQKEYFKILDKEKKLRLLPSGERCNRNYDVKHENQMCERLMMSPSVRNTKLDRNRCITKRLALFIVCSHVGSNVVKDTSFRSLLHSLDETYCIPDENVIAEQIQKLANEMKSNISKCLSAAKKIHFSINTWTKKGMMSYYLIVIAHFFSWFDHRCHQVVLAAKSFRNSCTTKYLQEIVESVLEDWDIDQEKIGVLLTDNSSSIMKSFHFDDIYRRKRTAIDSIEHSRGKLDDSKLAITMSSQDDSSSTDDSSLSDVSNCDFRRIHLSCFADTLQLIILKFTTDKSVQQLLDTLYDLVKKVNQSCKAADELFSQIDKKVIENNPTRWISTYYLIKHLLDIKNPFNLLVEKLGWIPLSSQYWKVIEYIKGLLQPFAHHIATLINRKDNNTTISCIIPIIMELDLHLESMKQISEIASVSSILQLELKQKFAKLTDCNNCNYDPIFAVSTLLDPRYKFVLNARQVQIASEQILRYIDYKHSRGDQPDIEVINCPEEKEKTDINLSSKRFHHLSKILQERVSETAKRASSAKSELEKYLQDCHSKVENDDPFHFWITNADYLQLASIAVDILSIPASSAKMETTLTPVSELINEMYSQEAVAAQECRILLRENRQYFLH